jgi:hypothetical protein
VILRRSKNLSGLNRGSPPTFFAGMPAIVIFGSVKESMTTALAPTSIPSASSISPSIRAPAPIVTLSPIVGALSEYHVLCAMCVQLDEEAAPYNPMSLKKKRKQCLATSFSTSSVFEPGSLLC